MLEVHLVAGPAAAARARSHPVVDPGRRHIKRSSNGPEIRFRDLRYTAASLIREISLQHIESQLLIRIHSCRCAARRCGAANHKMRGPASSRNWLDNTYGDLCQWQDSNFLPERIPL